MWVLSAPHPCEQPHQLVLRGRGEMCLPPQIDDFLVDFGLGRIRMDGGRDSLRALACLHDYRKLIDKVSGMGSHDRRAQDLVAALSDVHPGEPFLLAVKYG